MSATLLQRLLLVMPPPRLLGLFLRPSMFRYIEGMMEMRGRSDRRLPLPQRHRLPLWFLQRHHQRVCLILTLVLMNGILTLIVVEPRVYSITTLLHLSHEPEIKVISLEQKERLKQVLPEVVMNRKMRKAMEYHAIQERVRAKAQAQAQRNTTNSPSKKSNDAHSQPASGKPEKQQQQQRQRPRQRRPSRAGAERRRNASKVVDEASWRTLRLPPVSAV